MCQMRRVFACEPRKVRLYFLLFLTFSFFVVEVVISRITSSLAVLSDSFHMLSDVCALVVALVALSFAEKTQYTTKNTFGWIRAEVIGALVNSIFLTALCFTIILEGIERFVEPREIKNRIMLIGVGVAGLFVSLVGMKMLHEHTHEQVSTKKDMRTKGVELSKEDQQRKSDSSATETQNIVGSNISKKAKVEETVINDMAKEDVLGHNRMDVQINVTSAPSNELEESSSQLNIKGVFLHLLADALSSCVVVVNALIFYFVWNPCPDDEPCINPCMNSPCSAQVNLTHIVSTAGPCWVLYLDPGLTVIVVSILLYTTSPLLIESALILLQTVPTKIDMQQINEKLCTLDGVLAVHELHVWQLAGSRIIATAHIKCRDPSSYMNVAKQIKKLFHDAGIHATTIQPEFASINSESSFNLCELSCQTPCAPKLCCSNGKNMSVGKKQHRGQ
ncbi:zinc transporter 1-like [Polypterus senegalus]|uniref:zinc transporter 1-like n=1 Tax=Polypterus senegalus TaxID=55291 RepID=UPI001964D792|nr:zinc transporter 1-like [Polypterus senegalus]